MVFTTIIQPLKHYFLESDISSTLADLSAINPAVPVRLAPVYIPKPWGQEIWYTGMEARGESRVLLTDAEVPLSAYLQHDPAALTAHNDVLLLKVLDPKPDEVLGDLYFEVHEEKQEVYVVTHVDPHAWPNGEGGIRFGMNQDKRRQYGSDDEFRADYLRTVQEYETLRWRIDELHADISAAEEAAARARMDAFADVRTLRVGDVVRVPTWTPHSLLHGVRVVEFQTPTYERFIISFAQRVLTQNHWDSPHAIANMHLGRPAAEEFETVQPGVERIARFEDFNVWRVDLGACQALTLPQQIPYAVCMSLSGETRVGDIELQAEQACFVPHAALAGTGLAGDGMLLIAAPGL